MQVSQIHEVKSFVQDMTGVDRQRCRVTIINPTRLVITDISHWSECYSQRLQMKWPEISLGIQASSSSLSGFAVVVEYTANDGILKWLALTIAALSTIAWVLVQMRTTFDSSQHSNLL
jgi:hypothetical protein